MNLAFHYKASGSSGPVTGIIYAERAAFARATLRKMGMVPKVVRLAPIRTVFGALSQKFDESELEQFYRYFSRLESKGAPRASSLADAVGTTSDIRLKSALAAMSEAINGSGMGVSAAMTVAGFPQRDCNLVANVENNAPLDKVLLALADELKRMQDIKRNIDKIMLMPKVVCVMACLLLYVIIVFISPKIYGLFKNVMTNVQLPDYALAYYKACELFDANLVVASALYVLTIFAIVVALKSDAIKNFLEILKPVRIARQKSDYAALWGSFSLLFSVGQHREEICKGLAAAANTKEARICFTRMGKLLREGREIDDAVSEARFPLFIVNPIMAAHRSSSLVESSREMSEKLIIDVEVFAGKATTWINFAITLVIAGVVCLFAMLTVIPMMSAIFSAV